MGFKPDHPRMQFIAMAFFVFGFIFAGSGWSLVVGNLMKHKPEWSVCGQDMCSCLPTTINEPMCPLCVESDSASTNECSKDTPKDNPKRVPKNARFEAAAIASQAGCASIFLSFVFGVAGVDSLPALDSMQYATTNDHRPDDPYRDRQTPPPRA